MMKNNLHKHMYSGDGNFLTLVRTHNKVLRCFRHQQITKEVTKSEQNFWKNPWEYAHKKLQPAENSDPTFDCETAFSYFTNTCSDSTVIYGDCLPTWAAESTPDCDSSLYLMMNVLLPH